MTWASPAQSAKIERVATHSEMHIAITVDMESTIKIWNCRDRDALATNATSASCGSLEAVLTKDGPFVLAGDIFGSLYTFRIPKLQLISRVPALKYTIDTLCCSPQKKWVFLNKKHPHISPKDPLHVISAFTDGSLDVYTWEERRLYLRKCYHLQNETHVGPTSIISKAQCDNVSIAREVGTGSRCPFLSVYILKSAPEN